MFLLDQRSGSASFNAGLRASASGNSSLVQGRLAVDDVVSNQLFQLRAIGSYAEVDFSLTRSDDSDINLKMGSLLEASGSHAITKLAIQGGVQSTLTLGGLLSLDATGSAANVNFMTSYQAGNLSLNGGANVVASGDAAEARLSVSHDYRGLFSATSTIYIGNQLFIDAVGTLSKANASFVSDSKLTMQIDGAARVNARGDDSKASFLAQFSDGRFSVYQLQTVASGTNAQASTDVQLGRFIFVGSSLATRVGGGDISVAGDVVVRSAAQNAVATMSLRTYNGDIVIDGNVGAIALFGNDATSTVGAKVNLGAGAGHMTNLGFATPLDYTTISGYGAVSISGDVRMSSTGYGAKAELDVFSVGRTLTLGGDLDLIAAGTRSSISGQLCAHSGPDIATPSTITPANIKITGPVLVEASGSNAQVNLSILADRGVVSLGDSVSVFASGVDAHSTLSIESPLEKITITGDLISAATAAGSESGLTLKTAALPISMQGGLSVIASGTGSEASANIEATSAAVTLAESVSVGALGEASRAGLTLHQGAGNNVSVNGTITMNADSGNASAVGAHVIADLQLGKLSVAPINIFLDAIQQEDEASISLNLFTDGGKAQLGNAGHAGTTTLVLGEKASAANQLLDGVDISFSGSTGKAIIEFGADQDATTETAIQQVLIKGFRIGHDELHFDGLASVATTARTLDGFINSAMNHFNTGAVVGTTSTQFKVADVFVGGNDNVTYLAYDHDGTGISAIITLDGVSASQYKTANGMV